MRVNSRHPSEPLLIELGWIRLQDKQDLHKIVLQKKIMQGRAPTFHMEELEQYKRSEGRVTRSNSNMIPKKQ